MQISNDSPLKDTLWYKIGGKAKYLITCNSRADVLEAFEFIKNNPTKEIFIAGLGTNLLFTDKYFDGAVIQISDNQGSSSSEQSESRSKFSTSSNNNISITDDDLVEVFAGVTMEDFIKFSFDHSLIGLEWAGGLPGTVGGAIRGNAGAYGGETKDNLVSVEVLDYSGDSPNIIALTKDQLQFSYRNSLIKQNKKMVIISGKFDLPKVSSEELKKARETASLHTQARKKKHPLEYPNCGSVFINPRKKEQVEKVLAIYPDLKEQVAGKWYGKVAVAHLIDRWGMKGYRVGDAQISEKHALFIVNLDHATYKDVLQIIDDVKKKFMDTFGFELQVEVEIVK